LQGSRTVIFDPFRAKGDYTADVLLISHEHFDHLSDDDIRRFTNATTTVVAPRTCEEPLKKFRLEKKIVSPNTRLEVKGLTIETVPAYNTDKFREPGKVFHPKEDGRVGYVVTLDGVRFYHAGDTDFTPEMKSLDVDVAFLPVSGTYVMTADQAAAAARTMKTKYAIPMHIASIVGTLDDAERFKMLVGDGCKVQVLERE
jgi:L-ascorbate metabolism protein UlaG (beta-lactamase superfamily)